MAHYRTEGIVLRAKTVRDADKVLVLYTPERGKLRVWAHGVGKPGSRKRGAVQPFCRGRYLIAAGREIDTVRQAEEIEAHSRLHEDLAMLTCAGYICELVAGFGAEGQANPPLYGLLLQTLGRLGRETRPALLLSAFEARLLDLSGFRPVLESCLECGAALTGPSCHYSPLHGGIMCRKCHTARAQAFTVSAGAVRTFARLLSQPLDRLSLLRPDAGTQRELSRMLRRTITMHLEYPPKSLAFLEGLI